MPDDPEAAGKSVFYIDDASLQAIKEPALTIPAPLDEYCAGETIAWTVTAVSPSDEVRISLCAGDRIVAEQTCKAAGSLRGAFDSRGFTCGIYTVQARAGAPPQTAQRQIILAPDPWEES